MKKKELIYKDIGDYYEVKLCGGVTKIDKEDLHLFEKYRWFIKQFKHGRGGTYVYERKVKGCKQNFLHRIIMNTPKNMVTDHKNGDTLDNRKHNLRISTRSQNSMNTRKKRNSKHSFKGVWRSSIGYWFCRIYVKNKHHYLSAKSEVEAAKKYDELARKYFGEFAKLNFPQQGEI